jgi:hypothetical protein
MFRAADVMKRAMKTAEMGTSTATFGRPPREAPLGGYGGPDCRAHERSAVIARRQD